MSRFLAVPTCSLILLGCHGTHCFSIDGVTYEEKHREVLAVPDLPKAGLDLDVPVGDVRVEFTSGPCEIELMVLEKFQGDASASFERGRIVLKTRSGEPAEIGDVVVRTNAVLERLRIEAGVGDVRISKVEVSNAAHLESGMGDVTIEGGGSRGRLHVESGVGNVRVASYHCASLHAESGTGDLRLVEVKTDDARIGTGIGDVELRTCSFGSLKAESGVGDIALIASSYRTKDLDTGLGSVKIKD